MSVIFETLQKLNRPVVAADTTEADVRPRRNTYALKSVLLSPVTVLLLALLVFGLGYGLVFGLRLLQRQARLDPSVVAAAKAPASDAAAPDTPAPVTADPKMAEVPPPPDIRHLEGETGVIVTAPAEEKAAAAVPSTRAEAVFSGPDVSPPSEAQMASLSNRAPAFSPAGSWEPPSQPEDEAPLVTAGMGVKRVGNSVAPSEFSPANVGLAAPAAHAAALPTPNGGLTRPLGQDPGKIHTKARPDLTETVMPMANAAAEEGQVAVANTAITTGVDWPLTAATPASAVTSRQPGPPPVAAPAVDGGAEEADRRVKRTPIPRYTGLVHRLQTAVTNGDAQAAEKLLGDFATVKGKDHPYLLKLKAYRFLQAGDYVAAEGLLSQVLALQPSDRDASVNMVVVEAHTGRIDAARRRVARLMELFPEDETLAAMGRRLN